ncbi:MAG: CinA family protein [Nitrospirae bacterium]|nr:CinA family protein [Nitrospirota bacterium]MBF0533518.1 CinA family protein [Nitrospirota bacterium]MBF0615958.1 CinA family protein [Nitrospirota bacterium]
MISGIPKEEVENVIALCSDIISDALKKGITISTAESCTGGMIAGFLTAISGSSQVFLGGVVAYSNALKQKVLGVSSETLKNHGAVSSETALEMVRGVMELTGASLSVSVTGVAGPGGGSNEKPVGQVCFAVKSSNGQEEVLTCQFPGDRERVRFESAKKALLLLRSILSKTISTSGS